jgi:heptose-I-phosphate ethanolaminephosphotransferase
MGEAKKYSSLILYSLLIISPSIMFYLTNRLVTTFLPLFMVFQIIIIILTAALVRRKNIFFALSAIFVLGAIFHWAHFSIYSYELTEGAVAAILGTNSSESFEFIRLLHLPFWLGVMTLPFLLFYIYKKTPSEIIIGRKVILALISAVLVIFSLKLVMTRSFANTIQDTVSKSQPLRTITTFYRGINLLVDYKNQLSSFEPLEIKVTPVNEIKNQTHVIVIGETARRQNWNLYGYARETNKYTKESFPDLLVFKNVISASNSTIPAIRHSLTYSNDNKTISLLDVAQKAGYKTFWLSNQAEYGAFDNPTTMLANRAKIRRFLNTDTSNSSYDDKLIKPLEEVLKDPAAKKVIILHLMGSHFYYNRRYPSAFNVYTDPKSRKEVNEYDNSILYTDFVLSKILTLVSELKTYSSVTYFSDHAESLFEKDDFMGHGGLKFSKSEVEIPLKIFLIKFITVPKEA